MSGRALAKVEDHPLLGPSGPMHGDEVTVIIITAEGQRYESKGTFESAEWETEHVEVAAAGVWPREYVQSEQTMTLRLRRVGVLVVGVDAGGVNR